MLVFFLRVLGFLDKNSVSPLIKVHRLFRDIFHVGVNFSGCFCCLFCGVGFGFLAWLVGKFIRCSADGRVCPSTSQTTSPAAAVESSDSQVDVTEVWEVSTTAEDEPNMGNHIAVDRLENDFSLSYAQLQQQDTQRYNRDVFGAVIREHNTGIEVTGEITTCCGRGRESTTECPPPSPVIYGQPMLRLRQAVSNAHPDNLLDSESDDGSSTLTGPASYSTLSLASGSYGTQSIQSGVDGTQSIQSGVDGTQSMQSGVDGTQSMQSVVDGTQAMQSGVDGTQSMQSGVDGTQSLQSGVDGTQSMQSVGDNPQSMQSGIDDTQFMQSGSYGTQSTQSGVHDTLSVHSGSNTDNQAIDYQVEPYHVLERLDSMKDSGFGEATEQNTDSRKFVANIPDEGEDTTLSGCSSLADLAEEANDSLIGNQSEESSCNISDKMKSETSMDIVSTEPIVEDTVTATEANDCEVNVRPTTPSNIEISFDNPIINSTALEEDSDTVCSCIELDDALLSADLKRLQFRRTRLTDDTSSLSSLGSLSPSTSFPSIPNSFDTAECQEHCLKVYRRIEGGIVDVNEELEECKATLCRLHNADTGEHYSDLKTILKLSDMVSSDDALPAVDSSLTAKAFTILRNSHNSSSRVNTPIRTSSLPPTPEHDTAVTKNMNSASCDMTASQSLGNLPLHASHDAVHEDSSQHSSVTALLSAAAVESMHSIDRTQVVDIAEYVANEWRGATRTAETIRQGYDCVMKEHKYKYIVKIRGDNYCALRATFCSMVLNDVNPARLVIEQSKQKLDLLYQSESSLIHSWTFANRLPNIPAHQRYDRLCQCLQAFKHQTSVLHGLPSKGEKLHQLLQFLNSGSAQELAILEAMKLLMFLSSYDLYKANLAGEDVPVFVWLMFARDTSETPSQLLHNHLNKVGDSGGLEQVEMCLLGYALQVTLQTFRLYQFEKEDFITLYPETDSPQCSLPLIAEDDRHYNTLL